MDLVVSSQEIDLKFFFSFSKDSLSNKIDDMLFQGKTFHFRWVFIIIWLMKMSQHICVRVGELGGGKYTFLLFLSKHIKCSHSHDGPQSTLWTGKCLQLTGKKKKKNDSFVERGKVGKKGKIVYEIRSV